MPVPSGAPPPLQHPVIGSVQGKYSKGVIQYLGIKYASLQNRLAEPNVVEYQPGSSLNAVVHGPRVLAPDHSAEMEMGFIQQQLPMPDLPPVSDIDGLNLNITVPIEGVSDMPVLVYIHGGGFTFGSSALPHYDQSKVVELSQIMGQPIIAVNINYRLGITGFLTSEETRQAGYKANRGLLDQRAALQWIKRYIPGFGGNPDRITVVGQSAGAASVNFLMHSSEPLFHQAILLGGSFLMMKPAEPRTAEFLYSAVTKHLGLADLTPEKRIGGLLTMPQERLVSEVTPEIISLCPMVDGDFIPYVPTFSKLQAGDELSLPGKHWCKRLFSIESQFDGSILGQVNVNAREEGINGAFADSVTKSLGIDAASVLLSSYQISPSTPDAEALLAIVQFITDISFYAPSVTLAEMWPGPVMLGHFNERNPWDGIYKGRANHLLDTAFLWGNYNQRYENANWTVARAMAEDVVSFTSNSDDLPLFENKKQVTVYGPSEEGIARKTSVLGGEDTQRNSVIFDLADKVGGLDTLLEAMVNFLKG